jgi:hypothetical protein
VDTAAAVVLGIIIGGAVLALPIYAVYRGIVPEVRRGLAEHPERKPTVAVYLAVTLVVFVALPATAFVLLAR